MCRVCALMSLHSAASVVLAREWMAVGRRLASAVSSLPQSLSHSPSLCCHLSEMQRER